MIKSPTKSSDIYTEEERSAIMSRIGSTDTKPEIALRSALYRLGLRYRLHLSGLPGKPDIVFIGSRIAVFVNGCFWHRHPKCHRSKLPKGNREFWRKKLDGNVLRDRKNIRALEQTEWHVVVVWECEVRRDVATVARRIYDLVFPQKAAIKNAYVN